MAKPKKSTALAPVAAGMVALPGQEPATWDQLMAEMLVIAPWPAEIDDPANLPTVQRHQLETQDRFLSVYCKTKSKRLGCLASGTAYSTWKLWIKENNLGFRERIAAADVVFTDMLEEKSLDLLMKTNPGQSPLVLMQRLNAELPDKYRPNPQTTDSVAGEVLASLRASQSHWRDSQVNVQVNVKVGDGQVGDGGSVVDGQVVDG